jgi:hypothetical protein
MGYELNRFESTVDDELICSICEGVLENPVQVISCEHVFCSDCLDSWLSKGKMTCPLDRETINRDDMKTPRIVTNLLAKLSIKCDFANYGCNAIVKLESLSTHSSQCVFNPEKPLRCEKGCGLILANRNAFVEHNCMEELHNFVRGQTEQINGQQQQIDELKAEIFRLKINNSNNDEEFRKMKQSINNLELKLTNDRKQTIKLKSCISKCVEELKKIDNESNEKESKERETKSVFIQFKEHCVQVDPYKRIGDIKLDLMKTFSIKSGKLKLYNGPKELEDNNTLIDYGIDDVPNIKLSLTQCDEVQVFVKIRVMNSKENVKHPFLSSDLLPKTIALRVDRNETIAQLKANVKLIHSIHTEDVLLTYGTVTLEDDHNLTYYNIVDGSFINYYAHL